MFRIAAFEPLDFSNWDLPTSAIFSHFFTPEFRHQRYSSGGNDLSLLFDEISSGILLPNTPGFQIPRICGINNTKGKFAKTLYSHGHILRTYASIGEVMF